jgi:hypothetical protein
LTTFRENKTFSRKDAKAQRNAKKKGWREENRLMPGREVAKPQKKSLPPFFASLCVFASLREIVLPFSFSLSPVFA